MLHFASKLMDTLPSPAMASWPGLNPCSQHEHFTLFSGLSLRTPNHLESGSGQDEGVWRWKTCVGLPEHLGSIFNHIFFLSGQHFWMHSFCRTDQIWWIVAQKQNKPCHLSPSWINPFFRNLVVLPGGAQQAWQATLHPCRRPRCCAEKQF